MTWTQPKPWRSIVGMTHSSGPVTSVSFAIPQRQHETLGRMAQALLKRFGALDRDRMKSVIFQKVFELGLPILAANPHLMHQPTMPDVKEMLRLLGEISPASGVTPAGGMSQSDLQRAMDAPAAQKPEPPQPPPQPPAPAPEPSRPQKAPRQRKPRDPSKGKGRRDDPTREPTQDELDRYGRR